MPIKGPSKAAFSQFADGGAPWFERAAARQLVHSGMLQSPVPGRTDKLPIDVHAGAYVLPADIPSALGQGNSLAGGQILGKMFARPPRGTPKPRLTQARMQRFAGGGPAKAVSIVAAGGEYIVHPEMVAEIGGGDIKRGHDILDAFVKRVRAKHISTLRRMSGPKKG